MIYSWFEYDKTLQFGSEFDEYACWWAWFFFVFFFLSPLHIFLSPKGAEIDPLRFKPNPDNMVSKVFHYLSNFCQ